MVEFLKTLAIACIPAIITGIVTYIVARKNAASQISIIKEQNKHDLEKLMEQHKVDIEHLKEAHRLDMEAKEQDHKNKLELQQKEFENSLMIKKILRTLLICGIFVVQMRCLESLMDLRGLQRHFPRKAPLVTG